ncbi:MAG: universal stress protein [Deltaproteobacteria bacterium]|nr:universal stress protein [Deltaproteobacteria bacterium]
MYRKVLVPLDGSALAERAVPHAEEIARASGAEILLLQAVGMPMPVVPEAVLVADARILQEAMRSASEYLERTASPLRKAGIAVRIRVDDRPPADAILHTAEMEDADLIVMSTHGRSGISRLVMGSVAESVLHASRRTLMLVKPERSAVPEHRGDEWYLNVP